MEIQENNRIKIEEGLQKKVIVPASEIIKKFRTKRDRESFCKENSKYFDIIYRFAIPKQIWV